MTRIEVAYKAFVKTRFPLPTEKQVADLEASLHIELPPDYRQFLLEYNGGFFTEPDIIPSDPDCPIDGLNNLGGIGASHRCAELGQPDHGYHPNWFDENDPPIILPIGYTLMGNLIYLVTEPQGRGVISLKKAYSNEAFDLATGIEEFFSLLREPVDR